MNTVWINKLSICELVILISNLLTQPTYDQSVTSTEPTTNKCTGPSYHTSDQWTKR